MIDRYHKYYFIHSTAHFIQSFEKQLLKHKCFLNFVIENILESMTKIKTTK